MTAQIFDSYLPTYEVIPDDPQEMRDFLIERFKQIAESANVKEIGYYLDEELLTGAQFIASSTTPEQYRSIFRKVIETQPLVVGANSFAHGINFDARFTLIKMWTAATDSVGLTASIITDANVTIDATNININAPMAYDKAYTIVEYLLEI